MVRISEHVSVVDGEFVAGAVDGKLALPIGSASSASSEISTSGVLAAGTD